MSSIDPEISWYYGKGREANRLIHASNLEATRTRSIIAKRLPDERCSILDIGGGAGFYAFWLTDLGHIVHLLDPVALHLEQARDESERVGLDLAGYHLAGAEALPFENESFDYILCFGPLYHLTERKRRLVALQEAHRVLRPSGKIFAAVISRYGTVIDAFFKGHASNPDYAAMMRQSMRDGQHRNPKRESGLFTKAFFHTPSALKNELEEAGFIDVELLSIEGPWSCIPDLEEKWADPNYRSLLLETMEFMEGDSSTIGFGGHIMGVASRPQ